MHTYESRHGLLETLQEGDGILAELDDLLDTEHLSSKERDLIGLERQLIQRVIEVARDLARAGSPKTWDRCTRAAIVSRIRQAERDASHVADRQIDPSLGPEMLDCGPLTRKMLRDVSEMLFTLRTRFESAEPS